MIVAQLLPFQLHCQRNAIVTFVHLGFLNIHFHSLAKPEKELQKLMQMGFKFYGKLKSILSFHLNRLV